MATHWARLKRFVWARCGGKCENCGCALDPEAAHLHHLTYIRKGKELPIDVKYLCLGCHGAKHPRHNFMSVRLQRIIAASRGKAKERKPRHPQVPVQPAPKDAAFDHVMALIAQRKRQRQRSASHKRYG